MVPQATMALESILRTYDVTLALPIFVPKTTKLLKMSFRQKKLGKNCEFLLLKELLKGKEVCE